MLCFIICKDKDRLSGAGAINVRTIKVRPGASLDVGMGTQTKREVDI